MPQKFNPCGFPHPFADQIKDLAGLVIGHVEKLGDIAVFAHFPTNGTVPAFGKHRP